jgi:hypothetical protein
MTRGHASSTPPTTGLFATLAALSLAGGSGAPSALRRSVLVTVTALLAVLAFTAAPALAAKEYLTPGVAFGTAGSGPGQFEHPTGVAVNDSTEPLSQPAAGDVYVADTGNNRVQRFNSDGSKFEGQFNGSETPAKAFASPEGIAIDNAPLSPSVGDVYVADAGNSVVDKFTAEGKYISQLKEGAPGETFSELHGIAVDSAGNLWVYQGAVANDVHEFSAGGALLRTFSTEKGACCGIAVDSKGGVYVGRPNGGVLKFDSSGTKLAELHSEEGPISALAVNPTTGNLLVDQSEGANSIALYPRFAEPATPIESFPGPTEPLSESQGMALNARGTAYVSQRAANNVLIFAHSQLPVVSTEQAGFVAEGSELLHGSVNSSGEALTECKFEYVTDQAFRANYKRNQNEVIDFHLLNKYEITSGQFTLTFKGETTPPFTFPNSEPEPEQYYGGFNLAYSEIQPALEALPSIGKGNVRVSGGLEGVTIEFTGALAGIELPLVTVGSAEFTPSGKVVITLKLSKGGGDGYAAAASAPCVPSAAEINGKGDGTTVPVHAEPAGLERDTLYHFRLAATNAAGQSVGQDLTFFTFAKPGIEVQSASAIGSATATLRAQVNAVGLPTTYHVDYGTTAAYGSATAEQSLGAPRSAAGVLATLTGLTPGTEYHFHFVATNALGAAPGPDATFTTVGFSGPTASALPDGRAYEMVSPPDNRALDLPRTALDPVESGAFTYQSEWPFRAAAQGDAVAYQGLPPSTGGNGWEVGSTVGNQFLAKRTAKGWEASDITPAPQIPKEEALRLFYESFTSSLSSGIIHSEGPEPQEGFPLLAGGTPCDALYSTAGDGVFGALFTLAPPSPPKGCAGVQQQFAGASGDGSHQLLATPAVLTTEAEPTPEPLQLNLYDADGYRLRSVNVLNDGKGVPNATFGASTTERAGGRNYDNVISSDGARVFWSSVESTGRVNTKEDHAKALYVRLNDTRPQSPLSPSGACTVPADACTVQLDAAQPGASGSGGAGQYWSASRDGSRVFFTDCHRLTADSTAVPANSCWHGEEKGGGGTPIVTGNDLYEYDFAAPENERLTDLTVDGNVQDKQGADVQGVLGTSEDGSYVYFVAGGALAPGATPRTCITNSRTDQERALEEEGRIPAHTGCNLYVRHRGEPLRFIQVLSPKDNNLPTGGASSNLLGDWLPNLGSRTAQATPDGHALVFESRSRLTGYDNAVHPVGPTGSVDRHAALEVFVYDAVASRLSCASCEPSGARPPIEEISSNEQPFPTSIQNTYALRWVSEDGNRVFFDTREPLVPQDTNGKLDVYEWEREQPGGGSGCPAQTPARASGGCVFLLSGGLGAAPSLFIDADAKGENVFFETHDRLVPGDRNENLKLYDARVGGGFPESSQACEGTGCQGVPPASPGFATPSSATFAGSANHSPQPPAKGKTGAQIKAEKLARALRACRVKRSRHRRMLCEAQARRRYGPPHRSSKRANAGRAGHKRRAAG